MMRRNNISLVEIWKGIEQYATSVLDTKTGLPGGAKDSNITKLESLINSKLPSDFKRSYSLHDGSGRVSLIAFGEWKITFPILDISSIISQWKTIQKGVEKGYFSGEDFAGHPKGPIKNDWFNPKWIPIVDNQNGDYIFMDLVPKKGGRRGQIIEFYRDTGPKKVIASGLKELLEIALNKLV